MHPAVAPLHTPARIADIPEVLAKFRLRLSPPDLLACVQVSRLWHNAFISYLWETIDDTFFGLPTILQIHDLDEAQGHTDADQIDSLFAKYGRFIRHPQLSWPIMAEAAYANSLRTRLLSFKVLPRQVTNKQKNESQAHARGSNSPNSELLHRLVLRDAHTGFLLSPIFDNIFQPSMVRSRSEAQQLRDWRLTQVYWLLVRANYVLMTIVLDQVLSDLALITSADFIYDYDFLWPNYNIWKNWMSMLRSRTSLACWNNIAN